MDLIPVKDLMFLLISAFTITCAAGVVLLPNPVFCALLLACTMIGVSALFFSLEAYFVAGVQLIVYAGAVMVLFVMVVMLFDLKKEVEAYTKNISSFLTKMVVAGAFLGLLGGTVLLMIPEDPANQINHSFSDLATQLFSVHVFGFEVISLVLLVVIVGAVALAKAKGGSHSQQ